MNRHSLAVVCFLWRAPGAPSRYGARHVNALRAMVSANLDARHRFVCVCDDSTGLAPGIEAHPIDRSLIGLKRYAKLMLFRPDAGTLFAADRLLFLDLDCVILDDLGPLLSREDDFVIWRDPLAPRRDYETTHRYNSSLILMTAGSRPQVWHDFDPATTPAAIRAGQLCGSDQAFIGHRLGAGAAVFTQADGIYGFKHDLDAGEFWPIGTRIVFNHGRPKAWELSPDHPLRQAWEFHAERATA